MSWASAPQPAEKSIDWDELYRQGTPPWDTGKPSAEFVRIIETGFLRRATALELGCGTGANAIYLAKKGFDVTAIDVSPMALERARARAEQHDALLHFVLGDVFRFAQTSGQFDLVYDVGFYHCLRQTNLSGLLDLLWRVTRPGSYYLTLCGAPEPDAQLGPPQVTEDELHDELGRLFEMVELRPFRFESPMRDDGFAGWSCLMRRPVLVK